MRGNWVILRVILKEINFERDAEQSLFVSRADNNFGQEIGKRSS